VMVEALRPSTPRHDYEVHSRSNAAAPVSK
jgi:hypothetical protein